MAICRKTKIAFQLCVQILPLQKRDFSFGFFILLFFYIPKFRLAEMNLNVHHRYLSDESVFIEAIPGCLIKHGPFRAFDVKFHRHTERRNIVPLHHVFQCLELPSCVRGCVCARVSVYQCMCVCICIYTCACVSVCVAKGMVVRLQVQRILFCPGQDVLSTKPYQTIPNHAIRYQSNYVHVHL